MLIKIAPYLYGKTTLNSPLSGFLTIKKPSAFLGWAG
jgi:hypothetical protein